MMSWHEEDKDGYRTITIYNEHASRIASVIEKDDYWIFDLGIASPGDLHISKADLDDPIEWIQAYIGMDIVEIELPGDPARPFLSFVDDESKAVWQVWDVIDGGP